MSRISAGHPSPDDSDASDHLDFNRDILNDVGTLVYVRVDGDSMIDAGIVPGTLLVVDREAEVCDGCIAVVILNGDRIVKRIERRERRLRLISENSEYEPIEINSTHRLEVFGVVDYSIRCHKMGTKHAVFSVR